MVETDGDRDYTRQKQQSKAMMAVTGINNMQFLNQSVKPDGGDLKNMGNNFEFMENEMAVATRTSQDFNKKKFQLPEINSA